MKKYSWVPLLALLLSFSSCELIGDIFKAGVWVGVIIVVAVIAFIVFVIGKVFGKR